MTPEEIEFLRESNAIEGVYDGDSLTQAIEAWSYLKKRRVLSIPVVLKVHKILMLNQPLQPDQKGYFRKVGVTVAGRPAFHWRTISNTMDSWLGDVRTSVKIPGEDGKHIRLDHIQYERIHPFIDGNGRTGRLFYQWQRLKAGLPIHIIYESEKQKYYDWFK